MNLRQPAMFCINLRKGSHINKKTKANLSNGFKDLLLMSFCLFLLHYRIVLAETSELVKSAEWLSSHYYILDINPAKKKFLLNSTAHLTQKTLNTLL